MSSQTYEEFRKYAKTPGVKIFVVASVSSDDEICIQVKKGDFLEALDGWTGIADKISVTVGGDILFG